MIEQLRSYHNFYHFSEEVTSTQRPEREALEEDHPRQGKPLVPRQTRETRNEKRETKVWPAWLELSGLSLVVG